MPCGSPSSVLRRDQHLLRIAHRFLRSFEAISSPRGSRFCRDKRHWDRDGRHDRAGPSRLGVEARCSCSQRPVRSGLITAACIGRLRQLVLERPRPVPASSTERSSCLHGAAASEDTVGCRWCLFSRFSARPCSGRDLLIVATHRRSCQPVGSHGGGRKRDRRLRYLSAYGHGGTRRGGCFDIFEAIDGATLYLDASCSISAPQCQSTSDEPMRSIMSEAMRIEARDDVLDGELSPWAFCMPICRIRGRVPAYGSEFGPRLLRPTTWPDAFLVALGRVRAEARALGPTWPALAAASKAVPLVLVDPPRMFGAGGSAGDGTELLAAPWCFRKVARSGDRPVRPGCRSRSRPASVSRPLRGDRSAVRRRERPGLAGVRVVAYARHTSSSRRPAPEMTGFVTRWVSWRSSMSAALHRRTSRRTMPFPTAEQSGASESSRSSSGSSWSSRRRRRRLTGLAQSVRDRRHSGDSPSDLY